MASQQKQAMSSTKKLVDHLVEAGRRAVPLEKRAEKEVFQEVQEEEKHLLEDRDIGDALPTGAVAFQHERSIYMIDMRYYIMLSYAILY